MTAKEKSDLFLNQNITMLTGLSELIEKDETINQGTKDALKSTIELLEILKKS